MNKVLSFCVLTSILSIQAWATDLGPAGNKKAAAIFNRYRSSPSACDPALPGKRVLLTGFGLFQSVALNSAGAIAANIADPKVWPSEFDANQRVTLIPNSVLSDGKFITQKGAQGFSRALTISGKPINLCVLVLDVLWDVAGPIVSLEMDRFQPEAVLMLGGGGGPFLEGGALNTTMQLTGYNADGSEAVNNLPAANYNLPDQPAGTEIPMLWDNQALLNSVTPFLNANQLDLTAVPHARPTNIYLCNQVSYFALSTAANRPISFAGGAITLHPSITSNPKVGFFHLPWDLTLENDTIERWGSLVTSLVYFLTE